VIPIAHLGGLISNYLGEGLTFVEVLIICVYCVILKIFLGNSEIDAAAVLLRIRTPSKL
jgi:hypothetical protein